MLKKALDLLIGYRALILLTLILKNIIGFEHENGNADLNLDLTISVHIVISGRLK